MPKTPKKQASIQSFWRMIAGVTGVTVFAAIISIALCALIFFALFGGDDGVLQHESLSPDMKIRALVIRDDCGATCGCTVRLDLKTDHKTIHEIYRHRSACDLTVTWVNPTELHITNDDDNSFLNLDISKLGLDE